MCFSIVERIAKEEREKKVKKIGFQCLNFSIGIGANIIMCSNVCVCNFFLILSQVNFNFAHKLSHTHQKCDPLSKPNE